MRDKKTTTKRKRSDVVDAVVEYKVGDYVELGKLNDSKKNKELGVSPEHFFLSGKTVRIEHLSPQKLTVGYAEPPFKLEKGEDFTLRVFIDKSMIEVFADDRQAAVAWHEYDPAKLNISLFAKGGDLRVKSVKAWTMQSIYAN